MAGLSRYQYMGSDLSSDPRDAMDPRNPALASSHDPLYGSYGRTPRRPGEEAILDPQRSFPRPGEEGILEPRQGGQTNLLDVLRQLGIL